MWGEGEGRCHKMIEEEETKQKQVEKRKRKRRKEKRIFEGKSIRTTMCQKSEMGEGEKEKK